MGDVLDQYQLGWSAAWDQYLEASSIQSFARVTARHKGAYSAMTASAQLLNCFLSGKIQRGSLSNAELPAVGDWCKITEIFSNGGNEPAAKIIEVLPRKSKITRLLAGSETDEQVLAANIDIVFVVTSVNRDFNINRLRRYVLLAEHGNARPVIILSKADLLDNPSEIREELNRVFPKVEYIMTSSISLSGIEQIEKLLSAGTSAVFVGSSGVGKSTLVNTLLSEKVQKTQEVRADDQRGKHTTSSSGLFFTANGGIIIDTPGLREVQVVADSDDLDRMMPAVGSLAVTCKFTNCTHTNEPECAVQAALIQGSLQEEELASYSKLERELAFSKRKLDQRLASDERKKWKKSASQSRQRNDQS